MIPREYKSVRAPLFSSKTRSRKKEGSTAVGPKKRRRGKAESTQGESDRAGSRHVVSRNTEPPATCGRPHGGSEFAQQPGYVGAQSHPMLAGNMQQSIAASRLRTRSRSRKECDVPLSASESAPSAHPQRSRSPRRRHAPVPDTGAAPSARRIQMTPNHPSGATAQTGPSMPAPGMQFVHQQQGHQHQQQQQPCAAYPYAPSDRQLLHTQAHARDRLPASSFQNAQPTSTPISPARLPSMSHYQLGFHSQ